jgi:hypothetical protein
VDVENGMSVFVTHKAVVKATIITANAQDEREQIPLA